MINREYFSNRRARKQIYDPNKYDLGIHICNLTVVDHLGRTILDKINLDFEQGTHTDIIGESGSGKTTLLTAACDIPAEDLQYSDNSVMYSMTDKNNVNNVTMLAHDYPIKRRNIGFVSQRPSFDASMTAEEEMLLDTQFNQTPPDRKMLRKMCQILGIDDILDQQTATMSGGQQQRVAIAAALAAGPNALLLDEATASLDHERKEEVNAALSNLVGEFGITVVSVTHDVSTVAPAPRQIKMLDGRVISDTTTSS